MAWYVAECTWYSGPMRHPGNGMVYTALKEDQDAEMAWSDSETDHSPNGQDSWLRELAIIATGPQSPLLQPEPNAQPVTARRATWPSR